MGEVTTRISDRPLLRTGPPKQVWPRWLRDFERIGSLPPRKIPRAIEAWVADNRPWENRMPKGHGGNHDYDLDRDEPEGVKFVINEGRPRRLCKPWGSHPGDPLRFDWPDGQPLFAKILTMPMSWLPYTSRFLGGAPPLPQDLDALAETIGGALWSRDERLKVAMDRDDVISEARIILWRAWTRGRPVRAKSTADYVATILFNRLKNIGRDISRHRWRDVSLESLPESVPVGVEKK